MQRTHVDHPAELGTQITPAPDSQTTHTDRTADLGTQITPAPDGDASVLGGSDLVPIPMQGGAITVREKANLGMGQFSMVQNMRGQHPGFDQRKGQAKLHTTADGTNKALSLYQFNKTKVNGAGYRFDGTNDEIALGDQADLDMGTTDFTILTSFRAEVDELVILVGKRTAAAGYMVFIEADGKFGSVIEDGVGGKQSTSDSAVVTDGVEHVVAVVFDRSSNMSRYIDGTVSGTEDTISTISASTSNAISFDIGSNALGQFLDGEVFRVLLFNLALTATEVLSLSEGADVPDKYVGASQTELIASQTDRDFSGANNWANVNFNSYDDTTGAVLTVTATAVDQRFELPAANAPMENGKRYRLTFTAASVTGQFDIYDKAVSENLVLPFSPGATNSFEFTTTSATNTGGLTFRSSDTDSSAVFDDFTLTQIGAVLQLEHTGVSTSTWWDSSGNELDGTVSGAAPIIVSETAEPHFLAQMSDGDVLGATTPPPGITTGAFGSELYDGGTSQNPGSWSVIDDKLLHSNGVDQHQIYGGTLSPVQKLVVYNFAAVPPTVPTIGEDYSVEVSDGRFDTVAILDSLNTFASATWGTVFICTPVPANTIRFRVEKPNGTVSTATLFYKKTDNTWSDTSMTDGTQTGGNTTLAREGSMTWTIPTDEKSTYAFGVSGFWYQLRVSVQLDSEVEVSAVTFAAPFQDLRNVWDGIPVDAVEVQVEGSTQYSRFAAGSVDLGSVANGKKIVIASADRLEGIYIDTGSTPNATGTTITSLKYWDGDSFTTVGTTTDDTSGMSSPGWITFPRQTAYKHQFGTSTFYAYWYELIWNTTISADVIAYIRTMPYFDVGDFGKVGKASAVWRNRGVYTFDRNPEYLYITRPRLPLALNGFDTFIKETGDGRPYEVVAMKNFYSELMVWQNEEGVDGGTLSLFYELDQDPIVISTRVGTFSQKSADVVDGIAVTAETDAPAKTLAFFLSRLGVCVCDGRLVTIISDDIQNYFDPEKTECIRRGYEKENWLKYDSTDRVIRMGLVSGTSATVPNIFPVYDLVDGSFYFDTPAQELSCMSEVEAFSGDVNRIQVGGGVDDGFVYRVNTGTDDVAAAIVSYVQTELDAGGLEFDLSEVITRTKAQAAGSVVITPYIKEVSQATTFSGTSTNLTFVDGGGSSDTLTDSGNNFVTDGFVTGDTVVVSGATTPANDGVYTATGVAAGTLTFATGSWDTGEVGATGMTVIATITRSMTASVSGDASRRHRFYTSQIGDHVALRLENVAASQALYLESLRVKLDNLHDR